MTTTDQQGRIDQGQPLISWQTKSTLTMVALAVSALMLWWATLALTATGAVSLRLTVSALTHGHPLTGLKPAARPASQATTFTVFAVLSVATYTLLLAGIFIVGRCLRGRRGRRGFSSRTQARDGLGEARARRTAAQTRPGLGNTANRKAAVEQIGLPLGRTSNGVPVVLPLEDHVIVVSLTGGGKSRDVMIPAALSAPGPLVLTSTRADALDVVATRRSRLGNVWVFDPLDRTGWPSPMCWDPVAGCEDGATAVSRGLAFASGLGADDRGSTNAGFFRAAAASAMTRLLHAAALSGRPISDVIDWATHLDDGALEPQRIIDTSDHPLAEKSWSGLLRSVATGAADTVSSTRQTLQQAIEPMALRRVLRWVTPAEGVPAFDARAFVTSCDTLVLVADQNASTNVAPLCTMLLQDVVDAAKARAVRLPGGRLDPPLRLVGDEIANVAPLPKLPDLGTDARGFGMQLVLAIQSLAQAKRRWGSDGAHTLLDNMPAELLLGGITDVEALNRYAALVGEVELDRVTNSYDMSGRATATSQQTTERKALRPDEARTLPDGQALLIYRNQPPALLTLTPWYQLKAGARLEAERATVEAWRLTSATPA